MNNNRIEQLISKRANTTTLILRVAAVVASIFILMIAFMFIQIYALVLGFFIIYLDYLAFLYTDIEYEYMYLDGTISFDKIYGKNKRKEGHIFEIKNAEIIAPEDSESIQRYGTATQIKIQDYSSGYGIEKVYAMVIADQGKTALILFEPNDEMLSAMKMCSPSKVTIDSYIKI